MIGSTLGLGLSLVAVALVAAALALWFRFVADVNLGGRRAPLFAMTGAGAVIGLVALTREPGWIGGALALIAILLGVLWIVLGLVASQSKQRPAIAVGAPMLEFSAPDHRGEAFELSSLRGHPVLLKLFRGHW